MFVFLEATSQNLIADAFTSLALTIAFYYGITGYACTWFYRRHLFKSFKNFLYLAFLPLLGGGILTWVFIKASIDYSATDGGYAKPFLGVGSPVVITAVMIIIGLVLLIAQRINNPTFFKRKPEPVDPALMPAVTGGAGMSAQLVVGCDGTEGARAALEEAVRLAKEIGGSIVAAYAYDKILSGGELRDLDEAIEERGNALLAEDANTSRAPVSGALEFVEGRPAQVLAGRRPVRRALHRRRLVRRAPAQGRARRLDAVPAAAPHVAAGDRRAHTRGLIRRPIAVRASAGTLHDMSFLLDLRLLLLPLRGE